MDTVKNQWLGKDVDLAVLAERIRPFFPDADFETAMEEVPSGYALHVTSRIPSLPLRIDVSISGHPTAFTVEFVAEGQTRISSPSMIAGHLTSMFGGGYLILRDTKRQEALNLLERDFWKHVQIQVADLVNSAMKRE